MRDVRWDLVLLGVLMLGTFWVRIELATGVDSYSYDSYLTLRQTQSILETGRPLRYDALSVTGNERVGSPLFDYLLALTLLLSSLSAKILPNLLMTLLALPVFLIARSITDSRAAAVLSAVLTLTSPFVFSSYLISPTAIPLAVLVFLTIIYLLADPVANLGWIIGLSLLLTFLHPLSFLLTASLFAIILLLRIEGFGVDKRVRELFLFALMLVAWFHILTYKKALFQDGLRILWQNLPQEYVTVIFKQFDGFSLLYGVGVLSVLFGMLGAYHALFESRLRASFPAIGSGIVVTLSLLFRVIELRVGLILLSCLLAILAGQGFATSARYLSRTKAPWMLYPAGAIVLALFLFSSILPALTNAHASLEDAPSDVDVAGMRALASSVPGDAIILTTVEEGAAVQYYAGKRTLTDQDFLLVKDGEALISDISAVYTARFTTAIVGLAEKREFTHILFTRHTANTFAREGILIDDVRCLPRTFISPTVSVYTIACGGA